MNKKAIIEENSLGNNGLGRFYIAIVDSGRVNQNLVGTKLDIPMFNKIMQSVLSEDEIDLLSLVYGLFGTFPCDQKELAKEAGYTLTEIQTMILKALKKLRKPTLVIRMTTDNIYLKPYNTVWEIFEMLLPDTRLFLNRKKCMTLFDIMQISDEEMQTAKPSVRRNLNRIRSVYAI